MTYIEQHWYYPRWWLTLLLFPLALLFSLLSALRRVAYRLGWLTSVEIGVPVVIIGNINVGGVGKTPLTIALIHALQVRGVKVGVISRGYRGSHPGPLLVTQEVTPQQVGDEALLISETGVPVVIGRDRVAAARFLYGLYPDLALILSDDGLQHYRLARALEIVVFDGKRGIGSGRLLPNGPLREPLSRLVDVDAIVVNGVGSIEKRLPIACPVFSMQLRPGRCYRIEAPGVSVEHTYFVGKRVVALAGIGSPERFFQTVKQMGIQVERTLAFPDHHFFSASDLPSDADVVLVTTKDAVKLQAFNHGKLWVLPVYAELTPDLASWIIGQLKIEHG